MLQHAFRPCREICKKMNTKFKILILMMVVPILTGCNPFSGKPQLGPEQDVIIQNSEGLPTKPDINQPKRMF